MSSPTAAKDKLFPGISATETKLLVLANVCLKNDKIDYDKLALNAGIKSSSAQTLFRNAKRKLDKLYGDDNADADGSGAQADLSPEETPSKRGKSNAKAKPRTPRTPKTPKTPKAPKTPNATKATSNPKRGKVVIKSEESGDQMPIDPELSLTIETTVKQAEDTSHETTISETATDPIAEPVATGEANKLRTKQKEERHHVEDKTDEIVLDLAVNQHLPESPLPGKDDDETYEHEAHDEEQDEN
ncbi:uncharacterized protein N7479_004237 [Penicillium vulpinum]|uniref:Uncharacterized protein n=1 Tax=Penicillium vulpinum TaxID=29845 RepID=A0A1V6SCZ7_9EURO|nr:uncharacterized protein N7479_004237 [Penicillium vulpinum]KAJ5964361.1 hypothetical protein N7479_004237 [Penicillium vulpinum]OQE11660.1 hypothetical protein PENVUL_c002G09593 [Penicillium vulpinum]